ncbi:MAG: hypothetical protein LAT68_14980 [Cyclobacteriaceae bacterium]|nr:hypothetical protein [Cyclobacteriaceae bacterium]
MKKITFNILLILLTALILIFLNQLGLLEKTAKLMLVPFIAFYYLGQYVERKLEK